MARAAARIYDVAGWLLAIAVAVVAYVIQALPFPPFRIETEVGVRHPVSAAMIAILLGLIIRNSGLLRRPELLSRNCRQIVRYVIPVAIVLIGSGLNIAILYAIGFASLGVIVVCIAVAFGAAMLVGRLLGVRRHTAALIGAGTAICGSSAIVALAPILKSNDEDLVLSISTVNLLGIVWMFLLPPLAGVLLMSPEAFGVWAGTTIHAVPQAIAAGFAFPGVAGELTTLIKLVRVAMLAPLVLVLAVLIAHHRRKQATEVRPSFMKLVPWFIWGFVIMALLHTMIVEWAHLADSTREWMTSLLKSLNRGGGILLTVSMAAIGMEVQLRQLLGVGARAIVVGLLAAIVLTAASYRLIHWWL